MVDPEPICNIVLHESLYVSRLKRGYCHLFDAIKYTPLIAPGISTQILARGIGEDHIIRNCVGGHRNCSIMCFDLELLS